MNCQTCGVALPENNWECSFTRMCDECRTRNMLDTMMRTGRGTVHLQIAPYKDYKAHMLMVSHRPWPDDEVHLIRCCVHYAGYKTLPTRVERFTGNFYGHRTRQHQFWFIGPDGYLWYGRGRHHVAVRRLKKQPPMERLEWARERVNLPMAPLYAENLEPATYMQVWMFANGTPP